MLPSSKEWVFKSSVKTDELPAIWPKLLCMYIKKSLANYIALL